MLAALALATAGTGVYLIATTRGIDTEFRVGVGLWFLCWGLGMVLFAWHGRWRPAQSVEETTRNAELTRRLSLIIDGIELLVLALMLLGLLVPQWFGEFSREHRWAFALFGAGVLVDFVVRRYRNRRAVAFAPQGQPSTLSGTEIQAPLHERPHDR
ncbi:MAG: hypothetical protein FJ363_12540 [Gemmatimonadetes bacterium]|nr:hypothetical protein [Gemmatimonadota bacterium]